MNELQTAPIGTALWVDDWVDRRHCLAIKVAPGDADTMVRNVPGGRARCRIFTVGNVPEVFLLFRFEGYDTTFINAVNYCGEAEAGDNQQSILKSLAAGAKLVFAVCENDEFVGGFESSPATTLWSGIIQALCDCPAWTQEEWDRAFRAFRSRRIPVDELWDATPQVIGISSYEDLDKYEGILRQEGYGALVDALQGAQKAATISGAMESAIPRKCSFRLRSLRWATVPQTGNLLPASPLHGLRSSPSLSGIRISCSKSIGASSKKSWLVPMSVTVTRWN